MQHVVLKEGHKLALTADAPVAQGLAQSIATAEFCEHHPLEGTVTAAAALIRWGAPTAAPVEHYTSCVMARAHRCIPQEFLGWLKASSNITSINASDLPNTVTLWEAIFAVRASPDGSVVPVAGTHSTVTSWEGVLCHRSRAVLDRYAKVVATAQSTLSGCVGSTSAIQSASTYCASADCALPDGDALSESADSLITAGTTMVVRGTLSEITTPHLSSSAAVNKVRRFHEICSAEFEPETTGTASIDQTINALARWLVWARTPLAPLPPFATPYGPSVLFFYHNRARGANVTNMTEGFQWNVDTRHENETNEDRMLRLTDFIRGVRGQLLHTEYQANLDGSFNKRTTTQPLHRHMRDEWASNATADPLSGQFISDVAARIIAAKTGNRHSDKLEHDIAMLGSSLESVGRLTLEQVEHPSLVIRVVEELAGRTTDQISASDAPAAIWVPRDDPEMQQRLVDSSRVAHEAVRAAASLVAAKRGEGAAAESEKAKRSHQVVRRKPKDKFSRFVTKLLRHTAVQAGLTVRPDGYVLVEEVMAIDAISENTVEELLEFVEEDNKMRYSVTEENGRLLIRANQGHTIPCVRDEMLMTPITDPAEVPVCLHGTYEGAWELIKASALDRMARNVINMAVGLPDNPDVKSGIRTNIEVLIYIDVARAMAAGIPFFRSANNVICSPGPIPPEFFAHVVRRTDNAILYEQSWQE